MTTRSRRWPLLRFTLLLAVAWSGTPAPAEATVTATVVGTELRVTGDAASNHIQLRLSADTLRVEVRDGPTLVNSVLRSTFTAIVVDAGAGSDNVVMDEDNGAFTTAHQTTILGGDGIDILIGGAGAETIDGGADSDDIRGGAGNDTIRGGAGNDSFVWNANAVFLTPTDGSDVIEGGDGDDQLFVTGNALAESYTLTGAGTRAVLARGSVQIDTGTTERLLLLLEGGNDTFTAADDVVPMTSLTVQGGDGNDTIDGGGGDDVLWGQAGDDGLEGGPGNDNLYGDVGADTLSGGAGDDLLRGFFGDGNDAYAGGPGADTLQVAGTFGAETVSFVNGPGSILILVSPGAEVYTTNTLETVQLGLNGGDDTVSGNSTALSLHVTGGPGNDHITGGSGSDILEGGPGNDEIDGGDGDDLIRWRAGDWDDDIDGQGGTDTFRLEGGDVLEQVRVTGQLFPFHVEYGGYQQPPMNVQDVRFVERVEISMGGQPDLCFLDEGLGALLQRITVDMGAGADVLSTTATSGRVVLDGGADEDRLQFSALGQSLQRQPGIIATQGAVRVSHVNVELFNFPGTAGQLPTVTITTPTSDPATTATAAFIALAGTVADDGGATTVTWWNDRGGNGTAGGTASWNAQNVPLQPGPNVITVSAFDAQGNVSFDTITVTVSTLTYSLAEGATGSFFDLDVLIANPTTTPAPVTVTFLREAGAPIVQNFTLAATSRHTIHVDDVPGLESQGGVSTVVTSTTGIPIVVERTMFWDQAYYGSHGGTAVDGPRTRWLFAEGSEGFFRTFVLLANSGSTAATVTLTFLREGATPFTKVVAIPPAARMTIAAGAIPELVGRSFSIVVDSTLPIIAERAMYFGTARLFDGGHESPGVAEGSTSWFLAEGATGPFFETFVLVGNPNPTPANVTFTFLTDGGVSVTRNKTVPANGRLTVNIESESPALANAAVATTVTADQPVVAERAMYWPGPPSTWAEAHNGFGATAVSPKWGLAEGRVGMAQNFQTYILLANPAATAANVQITFLRGNGSTVVKTFTVAPNSRFNVAAGSAAPELQNETFGALIEVTNGVGISVERAMYSDALGQVWAAGTNALGTRLP